jgi:hypothetical protein
MGCDSGVAEMPRIANSSCGGSQLVAPGSYGSGCELSGLLMRTRNRPHGLDLAFVWNSSKVLESYLMEAVI